MSEVRYQYQIQATLGPNAGLFSKGGYSPTYSKKGKVWMTLGYLKQHLCIGAMDKYKKDGAKIVVTEVHVTESDVTLEEVYADLQQQQIKKDAERAKRNAEYKRRQDELEYERLKQRLGK